MDDHHPSEGSTPRNRALRRLLGHRDLLRRDAADRLTAPAARLVVTPDGREIRTIVTGRKKAVTGSYASRKSGRPMPYESMNERGFFMLSEVDTDIVDYAAQPFRLEFTLHGQARAYIPDCLRLCADDSLEVVEVKSEARALKEPDYEAKLQVVDAYCRSLGVRFRPVIRTEIFEPPHYFRNVEDVQLHRHAQFGSADAFSIYEELVGAQIAPISELCRACNWDERLGLALLCAMMVQRIVQIDFSTPLNRHSFVKLCPEASQACGVAQ